MRYLYFLQQFFERLPSPAFIKDNKGKFIWVNKELENVFQLPEEKLIGRRESELLEDIQIDELDKKVIRTRRNQTHEKVINARHYNIQRMPIRLGTGAYGVAGIMFDITERVLEETLYRLQSFVEKIIIESLSLSEGDPTKFTIELSRKFHAKYSHIAIVLLKNNEYLIGVEDSKLIEKAKKIDEVIIFTHDKKNYQVIPVENYKFIIHVPEQYLSIAKVLSSFSLSHILAAIRFLQAQKIYKDTVMSFESIIKLIRLWENTHSIEEYLQALLAEIVKIIPEAQKGSVWLLEGDIYKCVAVYNYDDEVKNTTFKASEDNYGPVIGENRVLELLEAYKLNLESPQKELWKRKGVTDANFIPLVGSVKICEKRLVIISIDNFEGKRFSETSKKILQILVDLLSLFLKNKV